MILYSKIEGNGMPLLILHGFLGMSDNWKSLGSQFATQEFQVHLLDLRNHGRSFQSKIFDYNVMAQDVKEYCDAKNLETISLLGHSMGGKVAMLFATKYPEKVSKLIIADIAPKFYPQHHQTILEGLLAIDFSEKPSRITVDSIISEYVSDFGTRQFLLKNLYWTAPDQLAFRFNLQNLVENIDEIGKALPKKNIFNNPTLFVRGGNSRYILDEDLPEIRFHFPNSELKTIPAAGHWLHAENPKLFYEIVVQFLS